MNVYNLNGYIMNDSFHSFFLAGAIGLYLIIMAIIMTSRASYYRSILTNIHAGSSTVVVAGSIGLFFGIVFVLLHNIWIWESEVVITVFAWLLLIKSILWLGFPEMMADISRRTYSGWGYYGVAILMALLGIFLMAHGFHFFI